MDMTEKNKDMKARPNRYFRLNSDAIRAALRDLGKDNKWLESYLATTSHTVARLVYDERVPGPIIMSKLMDLTGLPEEQLLIPLSSGVRRA